MRANPFSKNNIIKFKEGVFCLKIHTAWGETGTAYGCGCTPHVTPPLGICRIREGRGYNLDYEFFWAQGQLNIPYYKQLHVCEIRW